MWLMERPKLGIRTSSRKKSVPTVNMYIIIIFIMVVIIVSTILILVRALFASTLLINIAHPPRHSALTVIAVKAAGQVSQSLTRFFDSYSSVPSFHSFIQRVRFCLSLLLCSGGRSRSCHQTGPFQLANLPLMAVNGRLSMADLTVLVWDLDCHVAASPKAAPRRTFLPLSSFNHQDEPRLAT